jgi:hypothetical protein
MASVIVTVEPSNKRIYMAQQLPSILTLPEHIQISVMKNLNMVEALVLCTHAPHMKYIFDKIKWHAFHYRNNEKISMLIKAFESLNINIIELLFKTIKYTEIDKINIDNNTFNKIIEICYYNNFIEGIQFLAELKDNHYNDYKNHTNNEDNQYELVSLYIRNNPIEPHKIFLQLIITNNNNELFDYVEQHYSYGVALHFNNYKNELFTTCKNTTLIKRIYNNLMNQTTNIEIANYYNNEIQARAVQRNIIF